MKLDSPYARSSVQNLVLEAHLTLAITRNERRHTLIRNR